MSTKTQQVEYRVTWMMYPTAYDATLHERLFTSQRKARQFFVATKQDRTRVKLEKMTIELLDEVDE